MENVISENFSADCPQAIQIAQTVIYKELLIHLYARP